MRGGPSPNDGGYYGSYGRGFGIKKRSWFGGRSRLLGSRPAFMEPLLGVPLGVPPPHDGRAGWLDNGGASGGASGGAGGGAGGRAGGGAGGGAPLQFMKRSRSSFPLKDDAGYIGYLTDDDESSGSSGDEGNTSNIMCMVRRRRRELIGHDLSFSGCLFLMTTVGCLLLLFMFAVSPWGVPPPRRL